MYIHHTSMSVCVCVSACVDFLCAFRCVVRLFVLAGRGETKIMVRDERLLQRSHLRLDCSRRSPQRSEGVLRSPSQQFNLGVSNFGTRAIAGSLLVILSAFLP